ncbi:MAG: thiamine ABC transporter substrate-binding protein, partial [Pseudomonadota bacterium]
MRAHLTALALTLASTTAFAADKPVLNVYTYDSFIADWGPGPKVEAAFEAVCECDLQWVGLGDGVALLNRLKLEGANAKADVVLGLDTNLALEAEQTGLFAPSDTDTSALNVPGDTQSDIWVPYDFAHFAVVYDSEKLTNPPKSLAELVDGTGDGKIVIQDPRTSTPGLGFLLWMKAVYGEEAPAAWAR